MHRWNDWYWYVVLVAWGLFVMGSCLAACDFPVGIVDGTEETLPGCVMDSVQDPLRGRDPAAAARGRGFLAAGNHLGWDITLPEGRAVYPIGCGVVRIARAARGYGTLAVVIEHRLAEPVAFVTGTGAPLVVDRFLSIYGHIRPTRTAGTGSAGVLRVGAVVSPGTVIGYIENGAENGDGEEHLHLGIRLQDMAGAEASDPAAWFRGYDTTPSQRRWFSDPRDAIARLAAAFAGPGPDLSDASDTFDAGSVREASSQDAGTRASSPDAMAAFDRGIVPASSPDASFEDLPAVATPFDASIPSPDAAAVRGDIPPPDAGLSAPDASSAPPDRAPAGSDLIRYEFRVRFILPIAPPYRLRNHWWEPVACRNTGSFDPVATADGWLRCDAPRLPIFDASVLVPDRPDWGDMGQIGTVGNAPDRCTPTRGAEWRLTDLASGRILYDGPASGLQCVHVDTQDRWRFPDP